MGMVIKWMIFLLLLSVQVDARSPERNDVTMPNVSGGASETCEQESTDWEMDIFYNEKCSDRIDYMQRWCRHWRNSCHRDCGLYIEDARDFYRADKLCSCDPLCFLYDDCCYDVLEACPMVAATYNNLYAHLGKGNISCQGGYQIVSSCPESASHKVIGPDDPRDPILTELKTGIAFKNHKIYKCFYGKDPSPADVAFWSKTIESHHLDEIKSFLKNGQMSVDIESSIKDTPLSSMRNRMCFSGLTKVSCLARNGDFDCRGNVHICGRSSGGFCKYFSGRGQTTTLRPGMMSSPAFVSMAEGRYNNPFTTDCRVEYISPMMRDLGYEFKMIFEFDGLTSNNLKLSATDFPDRLHWAGLQLANYDEDDDDADDDDTDYGDAVGKSGEEEKIASYDLYIFCDKGYIFTGTFCEKPDQIFLQMFEVEYSGQLSQILKFLISDIVVEYEKNMTFHNARPVIKSTYYPCCFDVNVDIDISEFQLKDDGTRVLLTDRLIRDIQEYEYSDPTTFQINACLVFNITKVFICDEILHNTKSSQPSILYYRTSDSNHHVKRWQNNLEVLRRVGQGNSAGGHYNHLWFWINICFYVLF